MSHWKGNKPRRHLLEINPIYLGIKFTSLTIKIRFWYIHYLYIDNLLYNVIHQFLRLLIYLNCFWYCWINFSSKCSVQAKYFWIKVWCEKRKKNRRRAKKYVHKTFLNRFLTRQKKEICGNNYYLRLQCANIELNYIGYVHTKYSLSSYLFLRRLFPNKAFGFLHNS